MTNREIKNFHSENRTHILKKEFKGQPIEIEGAVNAPMGFRIFGNSVQTAKYWKAEGGCSRVVRKGKNLFDIDSFSLKDEALEYKYYEKDGNIIIANKGAYAAEARIHCNIEKLPAGTYIISAEVMKAEKSIDPNGLFKLSVKTSLYGSDGSWFDIPRGEWVRVYHKYTFDEDVDVKAIIIQPRGNSNISEGLGMKIRNIQIEEGIEPTDYEEYIFPVCTIKPLVFSGTYKVIFGEKTYTAVLPDLYGIGEYTDKFIVDEISLTARVKREIDGALLDATKEVLENTQAVRDMPIYEDIKLTKVSNSDAPYLPLSLSTDSTIPSETYPHKIYPAGCSLKCYSSETVSHTSVPYIGYAVEVDDFNKSNITIDGKWYAADYIEYDAKEHKAKRVKYVDETLFDETKPLSNQKNIVLSKPEIQEIAIKEDEYNFEMLQSAQDAFLIETEACDGVKPLEVLTEVYLISDSGADERKITYNALTDFLYDKLYHKIPFGEES